MKREDKEIPCANPGCTSVRLFTVRDQEFYEEKGFKMPRYCKEHSAERRKSYVAKESDQAEETRKKWSADERGQGPELADMENDRHLLDD